MANIPPAAAIGREGRYFHQLKLFIVPGAELKSFKCTSNNFSLTPTAVFDTGNPIPMFKGNKKYEVSDPAFYSPLIAKQKRHLRLNSNDADEWVRLGSLYESKLQMTNDFAERFLAIRYSLILFVTFGLLFFITIRYLFPDPSSISDKAFFLILSSKLLLVLWLPFLWSLRYPPSGAKYFKKALKLDPKCADAYMSLGFIALRRYQKKRAFDFMEQAVRLEGNNQKKKEREHKSVYAKEFVTLFENKSDETKSRQKTLDKQAELIKQLQVEKAQLENKVAHLNAKASQAKWETGRTTKLMDKEMESKMFAVHQMYDNKIAALKREAVLDAKENESKDFVRLTTEILELKAGVENQSFKAAAIKVEGIMGERAWQALSDQIRLYLTTAEQVWSVLSEQEGNPDFSLVGMELCKALETEINTSLVIPFARHLNGKKSEFLKINLTSDDQSRPLYFTYLAKVVDQENYPEITSLTLGQYLFVLNHTLEGDFALSQYGDFLDKINTRCGTVVGKAFLSKLKTVVNRYRNLIAHRSPMDKQQLNHLRKLVFVDENSLLQTCVNMGEPSN